MSQTLACTFKEKKKLFYSIEIIFLQNIEPYLKLLMQKMLLETFHSQTVTFEIYRIPQMGISKNERIQEFWGPQKKKLWPLIPPKMGIMEKSGPGRFPRITRNTRNHKKMENFIKVTKYLTKLKEVVTNYVSEKSHFKKH